MTDRRKRTPWFKATNVRPVHKGEYECSIKISSSVPAMLWKLEGDGIGFLVPIPMVVQFWRGLAKKPARAAAQIGGM
jgi:hypothetical protein